MWIKNLLNRIYSWRYLRVFSGEDDGKGRSNECHCNSTSNKVSGTISCYIPNCWNHNWRSILVLLNPSTCYTIWSRKWDSRVGNSYCRWVECVLGNDSVQRRHRCHVCITTRSRFGNWGLWPGGLSYWI